MKTASWIPSLLTMSCALAAPIESQSDLVSRGTNPTVTENTPRMISNRATMDADESLGNLWTNVTADNEEAPRTIANRDTMDADESLGNLWNNVVDNEEAPRTIANRDTMDADESLGNLWTAVAVDNVDAPEGASQ